MKDSTKAGVNSVMYKMVFPRAQWTFGADQCISSLFYHGTLRDFLF